jgi:peptidoglycan-associated lipoprotein
MKKNLTSIGILFVFILSLIIFTGCAEKKSAVKSDTAKVQEAAPAPVKTTDSANQNNVATPTETANPSQAANEQPVNMETKTDKSPLRDINFDFDSFVIRSDAREILQVNADYLSKHRVSSIVVEGHCDERGTAEYNMALGERRAQEARKYLVNLGVRESMIKTVSYGNERPLDTASNEEAWAKNRRAHFVVNPQ